MARQSRDNDHQADAWTIAQRWYDAIAKAQAGDRQPLALLVIYEGQPPARWRRHAYLALCNDAQKRPDTAALDDATATYARLEVRKLEKKGTSATSVLAPTEN